VFCNFVTEELDNECEYVRKIRHQEVITFPTPKQNRDSHTKRSSHDVINASGRVVGSNTFMSQVLLLQLKIRSTKQPYAL
jgi:hypothetical protein